MKQEELRELNKLGIIDVVSCDEEVFIANENIRAYSTQFDPVEYYLYDTENMGNVDVLLKCKSLKELRTIRCICVFFLVVFIATQLLSIALLTR